MRRHLTPTIFLFTGALALTGCGKTEAVKNAAVVTVTKETVSTAGTTSTSEFTASPSTNASASDSIQEEETGGEPADTTAPPVIAGVTASTRKLTLSDVFQHTDWEEGSVSVPKHSGTVQGIFTKVGSYDEQSLELRFADQDGRLKADVAQALDSETSNTVLEFQLFADQRLVSTALVKFNSQAHLETNLTGVSSTILKVGVKDNSPGIAATAVLTDLSVVP